MVFKRGWCKMDKKKMQQKKLLDCMKKEIEILEFETKFPHFVNAKINTVKNLKISAKALQLVAPYVLVSGILVLPFAFFGKTPFYGGDEWKQYSHVMTEVDHSGTVRQVQQYSEFENEDNQLYYYTKWQQGEDGQYFREIRTYSIKEKTYEDAIKMLDQDHVVLENLLGKPTSIFKETKSHVTSLELEKDPFMSVIVYDIDKNDYLVHKETVQENIAYSLLYILLAVGLSTSTYMFRRVFSTFNFSNSLEQIKNDYPSLDLDSIMKKLEIRKDNYKRLTR